jgi:hypothetical protein
MTYDDVINILYLIYREYKNREFPQWKMTDSDCSQMRRIREDGTIDFIEMRELSEGDLVGISYARLDPSKYSDSELWNDYGRFYHACYGEFKDLPVEIKMKYVFESMTGFNKIGKPEKMMEEWLKFVKME